MRVGNAHLSRCVLTLATLLPLCGNAAAPPKNLPDSQEEFLLRMIVHGVPDSAYIRLVPPLLRAIVSDDVVQTSLLLAGGADPNVGWGEQSALHLAVNQGNIKIVRLLLGKGAQVNAGSPNGVTPLMAAVRTGQIEIAQLLLDHKADVDAITTDGETLLIAAVRMKHADVARLLMERGADVRKRTDRGYSALWHALGTDQPGIASMLLDRGADTSEEHGSTLLSLALRQKYPELVKRLAANKTILNKKDHNGTTPLMLSAEKGGEEIVRILVENGAEIRAKDDFGSSACMRAAVAGHSNIVRYLVGRGADVNETKSGLGLLEVLNPNTADYRETARFLLKEGLNPNRKFPDGRTALHYAVDTGRVALVKALLEGGADREARDNSGQKPLGLAFQRERYDLAELFCSAGANIRGDSFAYVTAFRLAMFNKNKHAVSIFLRCGMDLSAKDDNGEEAAIQMAVSTPEIVSLLIENGVNVNAVNLEGNTPLINAACNGKTEIVKLLATQGANLNAQSRYGRTALICATEAINRMDIAGFLIERGANTGPIKTGGRGNSPLAAATATGNLKMIELLLQKGVSPNEIFDESVQWTPLAEAIFRGRVDSAKILLAHGSDANARYHVGSEYLSPLAYARKHKQPQIAKLIEEAGGKETSERATPQNAPRSQQEARLLMGAVALKDMKKLRELVSNGVNVNASDLIGETALLSAVRQGNLEAINFLLDHGADIELNNPLIRAVEAKRMDVVKLLVMRGAKINAADTRGRRALDEAIFVMQLDIVEHLLRNGANPNAIINSDGATLLISAAGFRDLASAKLLIRHKANVNVGDNRRATPLMKAAAIGSAEMVELFLASGAGINDADRSGWTALLYAVNGDRQTVIETLLKHGASITANDNIRRSPLSMAIEKGDFENVKRLVKGSTDKNAVNAHGGAYLLEVMRRQNYPMVDFFLEQGASPNARIPPEGVTVLMSAIATGNTEAAKRLIGANADINDKDESNRTALMYAVNKKNMEIVEQLIKEGANPNVRAIDGSTALTRAVNAGNTPLIHVLLAAGARFDNENPADKQALVQAITTGSTETVSILLKAGASPNSMEKFSPTPLGVALEKNHLEMARLLVAAGADVNAGDGSNQPPLVRAVSNNKLDHAGFLLDAKADVESRNHLGLTPLMIAAQNADSAMIRLLLSHKANINAGAGIPPRPRLYVVSDSDGKTPLMLAAERDRDDVCLLLLENGALINARSANGGTALMSAVAAGRKKNVKLLLDKGADVSLKMKNGMTALSMAELWERTEISDLLRTRIR